jgi:DNA-binding transcriptional ArsR family regulator
MVNLSSRRLNRTFAALADPTRRRFLESLAQGDRCVTELARPHAMSLPAVSKHLRVLEKAGLLRRRRGRVHRLKLEAAPIRAGNCHYAGGPGAARTRVAGHDRSQARDSLVWAAWLLECLAEHLPKMALT